MSAAKKAGDEGKNDQQRPWSRDAEDELKFRVPRTWKCIVCCEWMVAKTHGYSDTQKGKQGMEPLKGLCEPVLMQCCQKRNRSSVNVVCLPCFEQARALASDQCMWCKLKLSWARKAKASGKLIDAGILKSMHDFVSVCGIQRQPPPFDFAIDAKLADERLVEMDDVGVKRNIVNGQGTGLGLKDELESMISNLPSEHRNMYRKKLEQEKNDEDFARKMQERWGRQDQHESKPANHENAQGVPGTQVEVDSQSSSSGGRKIVNIIDIDELDDGKDIFSVLDMKTRVGRSAANHTRMGGEGRSNQTITDLTSIPPAGEYAASKMLPRKIKRRIRPARGGETISLKTITRKIQDSLSAAQSLNSRSSPSADRGLEKILMAVKRHYLLLSKKANEQQKYLSKLKDEGVLKAMRSLSERHTNVKLQKISKDLLSYLASNGDESNFVTSGAGSSGSGAGASSSVRVDLSVVSEGGSAGVGASEGAGAGLASKLVRKRKRQPDLLHEGKEVPRTPSFSRGKKVVHLRGSGGIVDLISSDDEEIDDVIIESRKSKVVDIVWRERERSKGSPSLLASLPKSPDYTEAATHLSLMFSQQSQHDSDNSNTDNSLPPVSRAAIWGALRMHGGNLDDAAMMLIKWQADSPQLLRELEGSGAEAIHSAGRKGSSPPAAKIFDPARFWECSCGRIQAKTVLRCSCGEVKT